MRDFEELVQSVHYCAESQCEICPRGDKPCGFIECKNKLADDIANVIKELLAAVQKWNPVSEPPKENGRYYVAYEDAVSLLDFFNGKWFFPPRDGIVVEEPKENILYWMPLPTPPKEVNAK